MSGNTGVSGGWKSALIGDVCDLATGGTPKSTQKAYYEGGTVRWLVSGDVHRVEIRDCEGRLTEAGVNSSNAKLLPVGSVIIALNGQGKTRGTVAMLRIEATCNQSLVSINPRDRNKLLPEFLFWNLRGRYEELRRMTGDAGNERRGLNMPLIRSIRIPLPPLKEQKRIVAVLGQTFAALDRARANAESNLGDAQALFIAELQRKFDAARERAALLPFELVCEPLTPRMKIKRQDYLEQGDYPVVSQEAELISGYWNDPAALMSVDGPVVVFGDHTCCLKYVDFDFVVGADGTKVLQPVEGISAKYLYYALRSQPIPLTGYARHFKLLRNVRLPDLPVAEQDQLTNHVEQMETRCDELLMRYGAKLAEISELRNALLQAAFSGQLA